LREQRVPGALPDDRRSQPSEIRKDIDMKNINTWLAAAALALLAATAARAETYDGVHALSSGNSRVTVSAEGVAAARAADRFSDAAASGVATVKSTRSRATVKAEAVATAHAPNQNQRREAFVNSTMLAELGGGPGAAPRQASSN
jgi:hypothetical protein